MKIFAHQQVIQIFILCIICTKAFSQAKFEIYGTANLKYNNASVSLVGKYFKKNYFSSVSTTIKNGKFYFSERMISKYQKVFLSILVDGKSYEFDFFIKKGKQSIAINSLSDYDSLKNIILFDAPFQKVQKDFNAFIKPVIDSNKRFNDFVLMHNNSADSIFKDSLHKVTAGNIKKLMDKKLQFIKKNSNSYFSLYEFGTSIVTTSTLYSADQLFNVYLNFNNKLKASELGKEVYTIINKKKALVLNNEIVNFSFISNNNKKYSLSQFKENEYILLCFWASWCAPCKKNIPFLKDINLKYSFKGLQMISVSIDDEKTNWLSALNKFEMPWIQTCDLKPFITEKEKLRDVYYIHAVPQYFLIDKNGIIIYHNFQLKDDDYSILSKTLNNIFLEKK